MEAKFIEVLNQFLVRFTDFKNFENIDEKRRVELIKISMIYNSSLEVFLENYKKVLKDKYTYDEIVFMFIYSFDKNCIAFNQYLELIVPKVGVLTNKRRRICYPDIKLDFATKDIALRRNIGLKQYGFFNDKIMEMERIYFNKYIINKPLQISFDSSYYHKIMDKESDFANISQKRFKEIKQIINRWNNAYKVKEKRFLLAFQLEKEFSYFGNPTSDEKLLMLILIMDPNFDLLASYYSLSNWKDIKMYEIKKLGFYNRKIILLEQLINSRFSLVEDEFSIKLQKKNDTIKSTIIQ